MRCVWYLASLVIFLSWGVFQISASALLPRISVEHDELRKNLNGKWQVESLSFCDGETGKVKEMFGTYKRKLIVGGADKGSGVVVFAGFSLLSPLAF
jgi:hypothetical protein